MSPHLAVGLALALASATTLDVAFLMQQHAVNRMPTLRLRTPIRSARSLGGARLWLSGFVLGLGGWALYFGALTSAPLSLVQTVAAGGIGLLVVIAAVWQRAVPTVRERIGAAIATAGLAALAISIPGSHASSGPSAGASLSLVLFSAGFVVAATLLVRRPWAGSIGLAAGVFYGLGDVWTKVLLNVLPVHPGALDLIVEPALYATLAAHGAGFLTLQRAFQRGGPVASVAPMTTVTNLLPMIAGPLVLGEALPTSASLLALRLAAFAGAAVGASLLAQARADGDAGLSTSSQRSAPPAPVRDICAPPAAAIDRSSRSRQVSEASPDPPVVDPSMPARISAVSP
jgi:uncharacterized membrane protein